MTYAQHINNLLEGASLKFAGEVYREVYQVYLEERRSGGDCVGTWAALEVAEKFLDSLEASA